MVAGPPLDVGAPTAVVLHARVRAPGAQQLGPGGDGRLPGEQHAALDVPDEDGVARVRPGPHELVLDAGGGQAVRQVADGLVIGEVGLAHPALGLGPAHLVDLALGRVADEADPGDRLRAAP